MSVPSGLIGLPCGEQARYSDFIASFAGLQKPKGTSFIKSSGLGPANPLNAIGRAFMDHPEFEWLLLLNDDNLVPADTIPRLWAHIESDKADVVSGLYFGRIQPFEPILFDSWEMKDGRKWWNRHLMQKGEQGLIPAAAVGDGCLMIRREVMITIPDPWWEYGVTHTDACDHDVRFSQKIRGHGFKLMCDLDLIVDHIANFAVRPHRAEDGTWEVRLVQEHRVITLPAAHKGMGIRNGPTESK